MITTRPAFDGTENCAGAGIDVFFHEGSARYRAAREVCSGCPMLDPCFQYALTSEEHGFWGGTSPRERKQIRTRLGVKVLSDDMLFRQLIDLDAGKVVEEREKRWAETPLGWALRAKADVLRGTLPSRFDELTDEDVRQIRGLLHLCTDKEISKAYAVDLLVIRDLRDTRQRVA